jgi:hypothetical protein
MTTSPCRLVRRQLQAFHDRELSLGDQMAVEAHLQRCAECEGLAADLTALRGVLRLKAPGRSMRFVDDAESLVGAVVGRLQAEHAASFVAGVRQSFEDMHLIYAAFGAAAATLACAVVLVSMFRFGAAERPDSLAAMVAFLSTPGSSSQAPIDNQVQIRWTERFKQANEAAEQDAVFTLAAVVTRGGRHGAMEHFKHLQRRAPDEADLIQGLLDAVARARFASESPYRSAAPNMLWLLTQTTVRAAKTQPVELIVPAAPRKRSAQNGRARATAV